MKKIHALDAVKIVFQADAAAAGLFFLLRLLQALVPTMQTLAVAAFVDRVTAAGAMDMQEKEILFLVLLLVALVAFSWISKSMTDLLEQHMELRLRAVFKPRVVEKISRLNYAAMENGSVRDKISRVNANAEGRVREAYGSLLWLLELILKAGGILVILFTQVWWLAFVILAVSIPCFRVAMKSGKEDYEAQADMTKAGRRNEYYHEMLKKREYVDERTIFGYQEEYRKRFLEQYEAARRYTTGIRLKWFVKMKTGSMAVIVVSAVFLAVTIPLTWEGRLSLGMFMALTNAVFGIVQNMSWDLTYSIDRIAWYNQYFQELSEVLAMPEDRLAAAEQALTEERAMVRSGVMEPSGKKIGEFRTLEFRNVSFRYPGTDRAILKNLSFRIQAGEKYAFVGANGAGKTTIIKLINGLYQDYEGEILVNGEDIRAFDRDFLSNVFQDFARYPLSVRDNITIGRKGEVTDEELNAAMEEAGLLSIVEKLEDGVDTVLGKVKEDSGDLSGGEWQKIALANFWKTFRKAYPLIYRPVWRENLILSFVDIFHGLSFALVVILTQRFFDSITASADGTGGRNEVIVTAAALIACQIASQLLNGFVNFYSDVVREKGYGRICVLLQEKISRLRPVDFEKNSFLTDIDMADEGAKDACEMVDTANSVITFYVPYFALMGIYMVRLDWGLLSALLLVFLPVLLTNLVKMHFGDRIERQIAPTRREAEAYERTLTTLENYRETRVLGAARYFLRLYREAVKKWNRTAWKNRKKEAVISLGLNCFSFLAYGGILLMLVFGCVRGQISVGAFAAVFSSIDVMFLLMEEIFRDSLGCLSQNLGRVNNFLNLMESPENRQESVEIESGSLTLDDVSFRYPEAETDCLKHISLRIADGETVAVVGENGAGKTTLARILLGIYPADSGRRSPSREESIKNPESFFWMSLPPPSIPYRRAGFIRPFSMRRRAEPVSSSLIVWGLRRLRIR